MQRNCFKLGKVYLIGLWLLRGKKELIQRGGLFLFVRGKAYLIGLWLLHGKKS